MSERKVSILISAKDNASDAFKRLGQESDALKKKLSGLGTGIGGLTSALGAGTLGSALGGGLAFGSVIKQAADFEYALYQTTKVTTESTEKIRAKMLAMPTALGSATELTRGYYQTISAGVTDAAKAMETLVTASKLSSVAEVTQEDAIRALTKMMAGYRGEIGSVQEASDMLLDIEQLGQASVKELIPIIGDLAGVSQMAGVSSKEMAAGLALLTQTSGSPSQAATQFRSLEMVLLNANESMQSILDSLGAKNAQVLIGKYGLAGALNLIQQAAEKSDIALAKVYGSSEAFSAASAIAANKFKNYSDMLSQVGTQTGRTDDSFKLLQQTFNGLEREGKATFENLMILVGQEFLPTVKGYLEDFNGYLNTHASDVKQWGKDAASAFSDIADAASGLVEIWESIPEDLRTILLGAMIGGKFGGAKGAVAGGQIATGYGAYRDLKESPDAGKTVLDNALFTLFPTANVTAAQMLGNKGTIPELRGRMTNEFRGKMDTTPINAPAQPATDTTPNLPSLPAGYKPASKGSKKTAKAEKKNTDAEKAAAALADLEVQINKLSMTDSVFREWELTNRTLPELMQKTGGATEKVNEFARAQRAAWERDDTEKAQAKQKENLDVQAQFYEQLAEKSGSYAVSMEAENRTIAKQTELWRNASIPEEYIAQWERLTRLESARDPASGMERGMMHYVSTATNAAEQMEDLFNNAFTSIGNIGGTALEQVFEKGTFAADEFFANLTKQLAVQAANAATNQLIGGVLGFLTNTISGAFGGGMNLSGFANAGASAVYSSARLFHSGGDVGSSGPSRMIPLSFFANAPRFHDGVYLRQDEQPAILQTGEHVLSRSDSGSMGGKLDVIAAKLDALASLLQSSGGNAPNIVIVDDNTKVKNYLRSADGQRDFVFNLNQSRAAVKNVANGGRA